MDSNKGFIRFLIIVILLIIIILLLLFRNNVGEIKHEYLTPTGHIDVFDIDVKCECKTKDTCEIVVDNIPVFNPTTDEETTGEVFVDDKNGNYLYQQKLEIFNNSYFNTNKIAPGISSTYYFVVHNSSEVNVKYNIEMIETSEYNINLKYRLKKNNAYVIGNENTWVTANDLITSFSNLNVSTSDSYALDWKWFDANNDTEIGENMVSEYKLKIRVYFEQV